MNNIKFQYLYRDGGNYKSWGDVVFDNPDAVSIEAIKNSLHNALLPDGLFVTRQIRIPERFLTDYYPPSIDDHCFHEFYSVEVTDISPTDHQRRSIRQFLSEVAQEAKHGWKTFDSERLSLGDLV